MAVSPQGARSITTFAASSATADSQKSLSYGRTKYVLLGYSLMNPMRRGGFTDGFIN